MPSPFCYSETYGAADKYLLAFFVVQPYNIVRKFSHNPATWNIPNRRIEYDH